MIDLHNGDCLEVLRGMAENSIDAIVTDPPYGLSFMGKRWDYDVPSVDVWAECLRVLKPGGHLLAFAGTRTQHRMAVRIEDAGFEIRDMIAWVYGSGFPKSHNGPWGGTALKPALEPITVARKPLVGTVEANWRQHGTGALNIDGCRIETVEEMRAGSGGIPAGRWPANLIHDGSDEVLAAFPQAPGQLADASTNAEARKTQNAYGAMRRGRGDEPSADSDNEGSVGFKMKPGARRLDTGSAARFFYCAKASKKDRGAGLDGFAEVDPGHAYGDGLNTATKVRTDEQAATGVERAGRRNHHPTVKPTDLMRYLCRLVTPPGGVVLDPFTGSGSTGKAAILEGFRFIGIEREAEYVEIARARIAAALAAKASEPPAQHGLFGEAA